MSSLKLIFIAACTVFSFHFAHPFSTPKVALLILIGVLIGGQFRWVSNWRDALILIWACWPIWQPVLPLDPIASLHDRGMWLFFILFAWMVHPTMAQRESLAKGLGLAAVIACGYSVFQWLGVDWMDLETPGSPTSTFGNPNFTAHFLLLAWILAKFDKPKLAWIGYGLIGLGILVSGSRAVISLWIIYLVFQYSRQRKHRILGLGFLILGLVVGLFYAKEDLKTFARYVSHPESYVTEYREQPELIVDRDPWFRGKRLSLMTRVALYGNSTVLAKERLWLGVGAGQFHAHYPAVSQRMMADLQMSDVYRAGAVHFSVLESIILFGLPWTMVSLAWLFLWLRRRFDQPLFGAVITQLVLSLVALNYQNPVIVVVIILFWPKQDANVEKRFAGWFKALWCLPLLMVVGLDFWQEQQLRKTEWQQVSPSFPAHRAHLALEAKAFEQAWRDQIRALERDPFGPETVFNTGVVAWKLGEAGVPDGFELGVWSFLINRKQHPEYRPARDRLIEIKNAGRWQPAWDQLSEPTGIENNYQAWLEAIRTWQPNFE